MGHPRAAPTPSPPSLNRPSRKALPWTLLLASALASNLPTPSTASILSPLNAIRVPRAYSSSTPRTLPSPSFSNSSQAIPSVVANSTSTSLGRYGHSAIYLEEEQKILFIGGQVGTEGTVISTEVLSFDLSSSFLWGNRPSSAIPNNPATIPSHGLPAHAWASSAADDQGRSWLIGGVTEDCDKDGMAYLLRDEGWTAPSLSPRAPPRRRQATAVALLNATTSHSDLFVFGGIAERFTCSQGTIGYRGVDRYDTASGEVEMFGWTAPEGWGGQEAWEPPVSDATAVVLEDGGSVAIIGGQTASGGLFGMSSILVFDVESRSWTAQPATGDIPSPRMGHVTLSLGSDQILLHGGLEHDQEPFSDLHLLAPSLDLSESWTWTTLPISDHSLKAPARAWHTATLTTGGTIVVAFGMDTVEGEPSDEVWFLEIDEVEGTYSWSDTFQVIEASGGGEIETSEAPHVRAVISNPKATIDQQDGTVLVPSSSSSSDEVSSPSTSSTTRSTSSRRTATSSSSSATTSSQTLAAVAAAQQQKTTIAATVGSLVGLVALVGLAGFFVRRRRQRGEKEPDTPQTFTAPFVSTLLYTRPAQRRMLSLGSTISTRRAAGSIVETEEEEAEGGTRDPFSDRHVVDEVGVVHSLSPGNAPATPASVASIPFLAALTRTPSHASSDSYTEKPPTLGSRRSRRLHPSSSSSPSLAEPKQEFGVALSSDSPRLPPAFLDFVKPLPSSSGGELFTDTEGEGEMRQVPPSVLAGGARASSSRASSRTSSSSTSTLRVVNTDPQHDEGEGEDPFRDQ